MTQDQYEAAALEALRDEVTSEERPRGWFATCRGIEQGPCVSKQAAELSVARIVAMRAKAFTAEALAAL